MRIATWNLEHARPNCADALIAEMTKVNADVWVLTESRKDFQPASGYHLVAHSDDAPDLAAASGECWVCVWARVPGDQLRIVSAPQRMAGARLQLRAGVSLVVVGTVLPWRTDLRYAPLTGGAAFAEVLTRQAAEWRRLRDIHADAAFCVAGDFNQSLSGSGSFGTNLGRSCLKETLRALHLKCLTADTVGHTKHGASPAIDHICVDDEHATLAAPVTTFNAPLVGNRLASDHFGVFADLIEVASL